LNTPSEDCKPANIESDETAVGSAIALTALAGVDFQGIGGTWCGKLLSSHRLFRRKCDGVHMLSLGFRGYAAVGWQVTSLGNSFFRIAPPPQTPDSVLLEMMHFMVNTAINTDDDSTLEQYEGIPITTCPQLTILHGSSHFQHS
jgi:hypothetical protein